MAAVPNLWECPCGQGQVNCRCSPRCPDLPACSCNCLLIELLGAGDDDGGPRFGKRLWVHGNQISTAIDIIGEGDHWWNTLAGDGTLQSVVSLLVDYEKKHFDLNSGSGLMVPSDQLYKLLAFQGDPTKIANFLFTDEGLTMTLDAPLSESASEEGGEAPARKRLKRVTGYSLHPDETEDAYLARVKEGAEIQRRRFIRAKFDSWVASVKAWEKEVAREASGGEEKKPNPWLKRQQEHDQELASLKDKIRKLNASMAGMKVQPAPAPVKPSANDLMVMAAEVEAEEARDKAKMLENEVMGLKAVLEASSQHLAKSERARDDSAAALERADIAHDKEVEGLRKEMALSVLNARNEGRLEVFNQGRRSSSLSPPDAISFPITSHFS